MPSLPITDFHLHVTAYRATGASPDVTAATVCERCQALNFSAVGLVEHLNGTLEHPIACMHMLIEEIRGLSLGDSLDVRIGAELDIADAAGTLRLEPRELADVQVDYVIAGLHGQISKALPADAPLETFIHAETDWMASALDRNASVGVL